MNYFKVIALSLAIVTTGTAIFYSQKNFVYFITNRVTSTPKETTPLTNQNMLQTQTNSEGSVTVKVISKDLSQSASSWDFEIILDTHSGNLDQDLTVISVMVDNKGNQFTPVAWEGDLPQGHHRQGILKFNPITPKPKSIELKINQVGNIDERIFKWELR